MKFKRDLIKLLLLAALLAGLFKIDPSVELHRYLLLIFSVIFAVVWSEEITMIVRRTFSLFGMRNANPAVVVISEPDIEAALKHMRQLPGGVTGFLPLSWGKKRLLDTIKTQIGDSPKVDDIIKIAPGVWALVKPFGIDVLGWDDKDNRYRLQIWLLIRPVKTDTDRVTTIHN